MNSRPAGNACRSTTFKRDVFDLRSWGCGAPAPRRPSGQGRQPINCKLMSAISSGGSEAAMMARTSR